MIGVLSNQKWNLYLVFDSSYKYDIIYDTDISAKYNKRYYVYKLKKNKNS